MLTFTIDENIYFRKISTSRRTTICCTRCTVTFGEEGEFIVNKSLTQVLNHADNSS